MRVYCHIHRRSFSAETLSQVTCEQGNHVLGNEPNDRSEADVWEYCCDCQNFWLVSPDGPGAAQCPACKRTPVERYLCDHCRTLTLEAVGPSSGRAFFLSLQGSPRPSCPGCSISESKSLHEHACKVYAATITTPRTKCLFCRQKLAGTPAFPMSVGEVLREFEGEQLEVAFDAESGLLAQATAGPLLVLQETNGFHDHLLVPKVSRLDSKTQFFQLYKEFYLCDAPAPGEIVIVYPATARREGNNWALKDPGRLRIKAVEPKEVSSSPKIPASPAAVPTEPPVQPQPDVTVADRTSRARESFVPSTSADVAMPSGSSRKIVSTSWRSLILVALSSVVIGGILVAIAVNQVSDQLLPRQPEQGTQKVREDHGPTSWPGMVYVPGGQFTMGSDYGDEYEKPAHRVSVTAFFIDAHEVTCKEFAEFIKATGHQAPPEWINGTYPSGYGRRPVTGVDWYDAKAYAAWAGKRLPTEEEWELAARGFDQRKYPWGNDWRSRSANAGDFSAGGLVDVGSYPEGKSPFGALDMVGNAWEWTSSDLKAYPGATLSRPDGERRIIRGGSWVRDSPPDWTTTFRGFAAPAGGKDYSKTGFRCAKSALQNDTSRSK